MKGNNPLEFNTATMIEAVQQYLDSVLTQPHRVKVLGVTETDYKGFSIDVESPESAPEALTP